MVSAFPLSLYEKQIKKSTFQRGTGQTPTTAQLTAQRASVGPQTCILLLFHIMSAAYSSEP